MQLAEVERQLPLALGQQHAHRAAKRSAAGDLLLDPLDYPDVVEAVVGIGPGAHDRPNQAPFLQVAQANLPDVGVALAHLAQSVIELAQRFVRLQAAETVELPLVHDVHLPRRPGVDLLGPAQLAALACTRRRRDDEHRGARGDLRRGPAAEPLDDAGRFPPADGSEPSAEHHDVAGEGPAGRGPGVRGSVRHGDRAVPS